MTLTDSVRDALEIERVESHLNPPASYDLADHPTPTGREETWRFTPLKRLRGILDGEESDAALSWETTLPDGVTKGEASGGEDNCNILTSGSSPGHEIALTNLAVVGTDSFEEALSFNTGCGDAEPTELTLVDRTVVDTSCLEVVGTAFALAQDGDAVLLVEVDLGGPATDAAAVADAFTEVVVDVISAR